MFATAPTPSAALPILSTLTPLSASSLERPSGFLEAASLQPRLHHHSWISKVRLSDDGFCDSTAHINLSHHLTMGLEVNGKTLSYRALAELGLSTRQAWDLAADNLVVAARSPQGTRFYLRDAIHTTQIRSTDRSVIQVKAPGAPITAWLAHPRTFTLLNNHLEELLGPDLIYLAPLSDLLIVLPAGDKARADLEKWAATATAGENPIAALSTDNSADGPGGEKITSTPLSYRLGFPTTAHVSPGTVSLQAA